MGLFDIFKSKEEEPKVDEMFQGFLEKFPPAEELKKPSKHILKACRYQGVPEEMLTFWQAYGFGNYGNGIIKVIDPEDYLDGFFPWIGGEDFSRLPLFMTAFGDLFYFRKLEDTYDISLLDIHYRKITVSAYSLKEFLEDYILSEIVEKEVLRKELFEEAQSLGSLKEDEIYYFVPALVLGGSEKKENLDRGSAAVHHQILYDMGNMF